jgi:hydrogenase-4 component B
MSTGSLVLVAGLAMAVAVAAGFFAPRLWLVSSLVGAAAALGAGIRTLAGAGAWEWQGGLPIGGAPLHLKLDELSALFLVLLAVVAGAGTVYARAYWPDRAHPVSARSGRLWWSALGLSLGMVLLSANGLQFLIAWEIFAVSSYFLISLDRQRVEAREAGWLYLAASHTATLCLFAFFCAMAARTGSWEIRSLRDHPEMAPLFWLALFAFGIKAGMFPLHVWLPSAHANAPSHVSAIMSGVSLKIGIYGILRFSGLLPVPVAAGWLVAALGVTSAILGVAFALAQHDLKRLLAYHSVENIGIILIGVGFALLAVQDGNAAWGRLALAGALLHVWNHGLFKALLFLGAGSVLHATGEREMSRLGGLWRAMPWTAGLFTLGAVAISGLPPLNGFVSEWLVYLGLFDTVGARSAPAFAAVGAVILLAMTGAMALACFIKVCGVVFLGAPRSGAALRAHESGPLMRWPMVVLAAACALIGVAPVVFWPALARATAVWNPAWARTAPPASLSAIGASSAGLCAAAAVAVVLLWMRSRRNGMSRALTWDCAYAAPTARMQYTAGSFAAIITDWFSWILKSRRHQDTPGEHPDKAFPSFASFEERTPEVVLERVVWPMGALVIQCSAATRRLQHGRVQAYLFYIVVGLAAMAAIAFSGGGH